MLIDMKNASAVELGKLGGAARALKLSKRRRKQIAKNAAIERWKGHKKLSTSRA